MTILTATIPRGGTSRFPRTHRLRPVITRTGGCAAGKRA